jgi:hypothetical protein
MAVLWLHSSFFEQICHIIIKPYHVVDELLLNLPRVRNMGMPILYVAHVTFSLWKFLGSVLLTGFS